MRNTDDDWQRIAETQPYWGVLSVDKFRGQSLTPEREEEFFRSGEVFIDSLLGFINAYLPTGALKRGRALDFGCGVGRLLLPLAKRFREAHGVDISPAMLDLVLKHATARSVTNLKVSLSTDDLADISPGFDLVNSLIVLQHIPPARGMRLIRRLVELTRIGGVCSIQMTYARARKFLVHEGPRARYYRREGSFIVDIGASLDGPPPGTITMFDYDLNEVHALLHELAGAGHMLVLPTQDDDHLGTHFVFLRGR